MNFSGKLLTLAEAVEIRENLRKEGKQVAFTNGCFDILHRGHVEYLTAARKCADTLIVGLNSDASVRGNKGPTRPVVTQDDRAHLLLALRCVDYVVIFDDPTPISLITALLPDVLVKGRDWAGNVVGQKEVEAAGGKVVLADLLANHSTTNIIEKIRS